MDKLRRQIAQGDSAAFGEVYQQYGPDLVRYLNTLVGENEAHDVLHDVFVRLVRYRVSFSRAPDFKVYIFAAARNEAFRKQQTKRRWHRLIRIWSSDQPIAANLQEPESFQMERLNELTQILSPEIRELVLMKVFGRLTFAQLACALRLPEATIATRYRRAIEQLRIAYLRREIF